MIIGISGVHHPRNADDHEAVVIHTWPSATSSVHIVPASRSVPGRTGHAAGMATFDAPDTPALTELLQTQLGLVSAAQLRSVGTSVDLAKARVLTGRWQRPRRGVFAAFSGTLSRRAEIWAALLRCGDGAVASHETAAELHDLTDAVDDLLHVTIPAQRRVRGAHPGIRIHHSHRLALTRHPVKAPPRTRLDDTVLDLVDTSRTASQASAWILAAIQRRRSTASRLAARLAGRKKIRWRPMAEAILIDATGGAHSMLEVEHVRRVERSHGLPTGTRQRRVAGDRVIWIDVDYLAYATRVELDGRVGHIGEGAFRDRRRDNGGTLAGQVTLRYGHAEVFGTPCAVAAEQAVVLQDRGWHERPRPCSSDCPIDELIAGFRRRTS